MKKTFWILRMKMLEEGPDPLALFVGKPICKPSGAVSNGQMIAWLTDEDGDQVQGHEDLKWEHGPVEVVFVEKKAVKIAKGMLQNQKMMIAKLKGCGNCEHETIDTEKEPCLKCNFNSNWRLSQIESVRGKMIEIHEKKKARGTASPEK